jgi:membrane protein DedA with SNARE-associated domain
MFDAIIAPLADFVMNLISALSYPGIVLAMLIESACIPLPSEVIMPFAGNLVWQGRFDFHLVAWLGAIGNLLGSWIAYWVGRVGGRAFINKWGRYVFITRHDLDKADHWFSKHGRATVFFSRMMPIIRTFISLPAGIAKMNFWQFTIFSFAGALPWCYFLTWLGFIMENEWRNLGNYFHGADYVIAGLILIVLVWWIYRHIKHWRADREAEKQEQEAEANDKTTD